MDIITNVHVFLVHDMLKLVNSIDGTLHTPGIHSFIISSHLGRMQCVFCSYSQSSINIFSLFRSTKYPSLLIYIGRGGVEREVCLTVLHTTVVGMEDHTF